jgi:hypothetical protein
VLAIVWFFFLGGMNNGTTAPDQNLDNNVNIEQPVNPGQQPPVEGEQPPADGEQPLY